MRLFDLIKSYLECPAKLDACIAKEKGLLRKTSVLEDEIQAKRLQLSEKENKIIELEEKIPKENPVETYWNNKYPKQDISYSGRTVPNKPNRFSIDVRLFFCNTDANLLKIIDANHLNSGTNDEKALKCLKWVRGNIKYNSDKAVTGLQEYWMFPFETLYYKKEGADCDDQAILISNLLIQAGVPAWRVRLNAGDVGTEKNKVGHCYTTYCRETDNQFVVLDSTYHYHDTPIKDRVLHSEERKYYSVWFSWNSRFAYGTSESIKESNALFKFEEDKTT